MLGVDKDGYGKFKVKGKHYRSHRWIYEQLVGPLGNLLCCHTCDNPGCVNPEHLYAGNQFDNERDKIERGRHDNQKKLYCPKGHPYFGYNLIEYRTGRSCRACQHECDTTKKSAYVRHSWFKRKIPIGFTPKN
jgi:hypothetical protein